MNKKNIQQEFNLSALQEGYFIGRNRAFDFSARAHYYVEFRFDTIDVERLEKALNIIIGRHESLHASIDPNGKIRILNKPPFYRIQCLTCSEEQKNKHLSNIQHRLKNFELGCVEGVPVQFVISKVENSEVYLHVNFDLILLDGNAINILFREISKLYKDINVVLPSVTFSYEQYSQKIAEFRENQAFLRSKNYWYTRLDNLPPPPDLPVETSQGHLAQQMTRRKKVISKTQWEAFKAQCNHHNISPSTALLSAYAHILSFWSKDPHFTVTMMLEGINGGNLLVDGAVGNFSSTTLAAVNYSHAGSFAERCITQKKQAFMDLMHSGICGVEVLQEKNRREGQGARAGSPVAFVCTLEERTEPVDQQDLLQFYGDHVVASALATPQVWLDHQVAIAPNGNVILHWDSIDSIFPDKAVDTMFDQYCTLLLKLIEQPAYWLEHITLSVLDKAYQLPHTVDSYTFKQTPATLHSLFWQSASEHQEKTAVIQGDTYLSYQQLYDCSTYVECMLIKNGLQAGDIVAVVMEKGWEQVVACLSILNASATYLPIDVALPNKRIEYILEQCDVKQVLVQHRFLEADNLQTIASIYNTIAINTDTLNKSLEFASTHTDYKPVQQRQSIQNTQQLAYIIFTSGSTGQPKGVSIDHQGAVNTILDINQRYNIGQSDVIFGLSSLSFDLSVYDIFGSFAAGATLVLPQADKMLVPFHWFAQLTTHKVTVWNSVPQLAQLLIEYTASLSHQEQQTAIENSAIKLLMMSGDWIPVSLPEKIKYHHTKARIVSLGGATEASIWSIYHDIHTVDKAQSSIPYGKALTNQEMYVLDHNLDKRPNGVSGQIYIAGIGLAQGYWKNPEKTAASFIHSRQGKRLYRTGDLGSYLDDGSIEFLGREDFQVKVQGYRVEIGEIETTIDAFTAIHSCAVTTIGKATNGVQIIAFVVWKSDIKDSQSDLQQHLSEHLPYYMVPSKFITVEHIPLTVNGKVDRKQLLSLASSSSSQDEQYVAPGNDVEKYLARLWQSLLQCEDDISINSNFFDLGGQSFLAIQVAFKIEQTYKVNVKISDFFRKPTISFLSQIIQKTLQQGLSSTVKTPLVKLRDGESSGENTCENTLFLIHPSGGNLHCYNELSHHLSQDYHIYGLRSEPYRDVNSNDLTEIAKYYLEHIRATQAQGPYIIGGWSLGGVIAFEILQQLSQQEAEQSTLLLIDSPAPIGKIQNTDIPDSKARILWFFSDVVGRDISQYLSLDHTFDQLDNKQKFTYLFKQLISSNLIAKEVDIDYSYLMYQTFCANLTALDTYHPGKLKASPNLVAFKATGELIAELAHHPSSQSVDWGWHKLLNSTPAVTPLKGSHYDVFSTENINTVSSKINARLTRKSIINQDLVVSP